MKKIILLMMACVVMIVSPLKAKAQWAVTDVGVTGQLIGLLASAGEQITTLSGILNVLNDVNDARKVINKAVVSLGEINQVKNLAGSVVNDVQYMLDVLGKSDGKAFTAKKALGYSKVCINTMDNVIRLMENAASIVTDLLLDATDAERVEMIGKISSSLMVEAKTINQSKQQMQKDVARRASFNAMLKSQGVQNGY